MGGHQAYELVFSLPGRPDPLNKMLRMHYHNRGRINKHWYDLVYLATVRKKPETPLCSAHLSFVLYRSRFVDWDGAVGSLKPIVDGIVKAGIIEDDNYKVTGPWEVTQEHCKKGLGKVLCRIKEMPK